MYSNLDVWAIQYNGDELYEALENIKSDNDIILYSNLVCKFKIGDSEITRQFSCSLVSEENDILIIIMRDGNVSKTDIVDYLNKKNMKYTEVDFAPVCDDYQDEQENIIIWTIGEYNVLKDALDSHKDEDLECIYYPFIPSVLNLGYYTNHDNAFYDVEGRLFQGALQMGDDLLLFISQNDNRNLTPDDIIPLLNKYNVKYTIAQSKDFELKK